SPERFGDAGGLLWEFTDRDDADIGNVIGQPEIVRLRLSEAEHGTAHGYFVAVTSGMNHQQADGYVGESGKNSLFLLSLNKPLHEGWEAGVNDFKLSVPVEKRAGMIELAVVNEGGTATHVYAADLEGKLWRFMLDPETLQMAVLQQQPLFTAAGQDGKP